MEAGNYCIKTKVTCNMVQQTREYIISKLIICCYLTGLGLMDASTSLVREFLKLVDSLAGVRKKNYIKYVKHPEV
jgi:hypothetical protein